MMQNCVRKASLLALAVLLTLSGSAFAGDNAGATFTITTPIEISGVGPGATVDVAISAAGMVGVKQFDVTLEVSPADAFDLTASSFAQNPSFAISPGVEFPSGTTNQVKSGAASFGAAVSGDAALGTFTLTASSTMTTDIQASITVVQINAGASRSVAAQTGADGTASITFDSEGDKAAGSTSLSGTVSTTAPNSDAVSRDLSVAISATWDVPVPAELASFAGQVTADKDVLLQWSVVSQSNNLGWEIYRSTDKVRFEKVGEMVLGAGTTDELMNYSFTDSGYPAADALYYYLKQTDLSGHTARSNVIEVVLSPVRVLPTANVLRQNFPNPFNPETTISFDLTSATVVELSIYDMAGQHIRTLASGQDLSAGSYSYLWDGLDDSGAKVGSGVYLYHLKSGEFTSVKKMALLK